MRLGYLFACGSLAALVPFLGCGGDETTATTTTSSSTSTSNGTGGTGGSGGTTSSGTGGSGGTTSSGTGGGGGAADFWEGDQYDPNGLPNPSDGNHNDGDDCLDCHDGSGNVPRWLFGGTVYETGGTNGAANVQVGVVVDGTLYTTYSATNGNFWVAHPGGTLSFTGSEARMRNANGEAIMVSSPANGACNGCHTGGNALIEP